MQQLDRRIKSYVIRNGRSLSDNLKNLLNSEGTKYALLPSIDNLSADGLLATYGNNNPLIVEIGFGTGISLIQQAKLNPDVNFLGLEMYYNGIAQLCKGIKDFGLKNIRYIRADAVDVLNLLPDHIVNKLQIFFPDPWPKIKHHKRRLIKEEFLELVSRKIVNGGILHIATDWQNYADEIALTLENFAKFKNEATDWLPRTTTKFEQKAIDKGHNITDFIRELVI